MENMYIIKRIRGSPVDSAIMKDDGNLYYIFLVRLSSCKRANDYVGIVANPSDIAFNDVVERHTMGPLPLSVCHKMGQSLVTGTRGFESRRRKLDYLAKAQGIEPSLIHHWLVPLPLSHISRPRRRFYDAKPVLAKL